MDHEICVIAHNIRSLWNVGSFFRSADCFGVQKIYLTGYTGTPPRREISKTALGAEEWIPWEQREDPAALIAELQKDGWNVVALELTDKAVNINDFTPTEKTCLLVGHEVTGVPEELLRIVDQHVQIPMLGQKESLNVSVATGIALHKLQST